MPYSPTHLDNLSNDVVARIARWFKKAKPEPTPVDFNTQLGVHFEEIGEMLENLRANDLITYNILVRTHIVVTQLAQHLKEHPDPVYIETEDRSDFLDSICDQIVTAVGVGVFAYMDVTGGLSEVSDSNDSKFDPATGLPILNEHGKIMKGPAYRKADLAPFI